ncbi:DUF1565 domain-containing protein [Cronbergia sp. UHCC 0137]|uniref:DUF1565 domain-containing protein n=1 Tax=Cronbergia sp. UHCC 0137 TaxID=3110239 RepID=UPI003A4C7575
MKFLLTAPILVTTFTLSSILVLKSTVTAQVPVTANVIYVNPSTGKDTSDAGTTATTPFQTITFALDQAKPDTVIQLAAGNYNTRETFPLLLKPGITLQGDESTKGQGTVITGGGFYISRTFAKQNITILANQGNTIAGLTVTNPNDRGTGIWVESTDPTIKNNTFIKNVREGVFITGSGSPKIENNIFSQNKGNGLSITKTSQGEIRNNLFQNNGFGLSINGDAKPMVTENQIVQNKDGIFISESAKPTVHRNVIKNNQRDGIVAISKSVPDLGTNQSPGGNSMSNNGRYDLNNSTSAMIVAIGNPDMVTTRIFGSVDTGNTQPSNQSSDPNLALIQSWQLTPISCVSGSQVITIMIDNKQYCVNPHPALTAKNYQYNRSTGKLKALASPQSNPPGQDGGL